MIQIPLTWENEWSYGDSNSGPLACHANSACRHMWLGVALRGVHLRLPWLYVAWRRPVSLHVGSPPGSQNSLAPLMFERPVQAPGHVRLPSSRGGPGNGSGRALPSQAAHAATPGRSRSDRDQVDVDPGRFCQGAQGPRDRGCWRHHCRRQAHHRGHRPRPSGEESRRPLQDLHISRSQRFSRRSSGSSRRSVLIMPPSWRVPAPRPAC
jgi:hypothetical protein